MEKYKLKNELNFIMENAQPQQVSKLSVEFQIYELKQKLLPFFINFAEKRSSRGKIGKNSYNNSTIAGAQLHYLCNLYEIHRGVDYTNKAFIHPPPPPTPHTHTHSRTSIKILWWNEGFLFFSVKCTRLKLYHVILINSHIIIFFVHNGRIVIAV